MKKLFLISLALTILIFPVTTFAGKIKVAVRVDGLSCPFCAYGLEKKLKKIEGVENFQIDIEGGKVAITFKDKKFFDKKEIERVVKEAGFTPREIKIKEIVD